MTSPAADSGASTATSASATSPMLGAWTVVAHHIPGVSAMRDTDAERLHGRTVRLDSARATTEGNHCDAPRYTSRRTARDALLGREYNLRPASLAPLAARDTVEVLDVSCNGSIWPALGGRLIAVGPDRALAPWDGVFFELARSRGFRALGQEPGWQLTIRPGEEMRLSYAYGERTAVTPVPVPKTDAGTGARVYHAVTEGNDLRVEIVPAPCTDVMSGKGFETTVTVTVNEETLRGCGGAMP